MILSIQKAFKILDIMIFEDKDEKGFSLKCLSEMMDEKPTTLHNILKTMIECGYVDQDGRGKYIIGKRCKQMGVANRMSLSDVAQRQIDDEIRSLCRRIGESISVYVLDDGDRICYSNILQSSMQKAEYTMLENGSIYSYPSGKIIVSYCNEKQLSRIIDKNGMPKDKWTGEKQIFSMAELNKQTSKIMDDGYAKKIDIDGNRVSYAVPIIYQNGDLFGAIGAYMPIERASEQKEHYVLEQLNNSAEFISKILK